MDARRQSLALGLDATLTEGLAERILLFRLLLANGTELRTRTDRLLADQGLTTQQAMLLQVLQSEAAPPSLKQLAARLAMSHQNLKQIATVLERKGFLEIVIDPSDKRLRRLQLTQHHHRFWRKRNPNDYAEVEQWTAALSLPEVRSLVKGLDKLHEGLMKSRNSQN